MAAAALTDSIVLPQPPARRICVKKGSKPDAASLQLWLQKHGHNVHKLHLNLQQQRHGTDGRDLLQLPCPNLQELLLQECTLGPAAQVRSNIAA